MRTAFDWGISDIVSKNNHKGENSLYIDNSEFYFYTQTLLLFKRGFSLNNSLIRKLKFIDENRLVKEKGLCNTMTSLLSGAAGNINEKPKRRLHIRGLDYIPEEFKKLHQEEIDKYDDFLNNQSSASLSIPIDYLICQKSKTSPKILSTIPQLMGIGSKSERVSVKIGNKIKAIIRPWMDLRVTDDVILFMLEMGLLEVDASSERNVKLTPVGNQCAAVVEYSIRNECDLEVLSVVSYYCLRDIFIRNAGIYSVLRILDNKGPLTPVEINNYMCGSGNNGLIYINPRIIMLKCEALGVHTQVVPAKATDTGKFVQHYIDVLESEGYIESVSIKRHFKYWGERHSFIFTHYQLSEMGRKLYRTRERHDQDLYSAYFNFQNENTVEKYLSRMRFEIINFIHNTPMTVWQIEDRIFTLGYYVLHPMVLDMIKDIIACGYNLKATRNNVEFDPFVELNNPTFAYDKFDYANTYFWVENVNIISKHVNRYAIKAPNAIASNQVFTSQLLTTNHLYAQLPLYEDRAARNKFARENYIYNMKFAFVQACSDIGVTAECSIKTDEECAYAQFLNWSGYADFGNYYTNAEDFDFDNFNKRLLASETYKYVIDSSEKLKCGRFILFVTQEPDKYIDEVVPKIKERYKVESFAIRFETFLIQIEKHRSDKEVDFFGQFHDVIHSNTEDLFGSRESINQWQLEGKTFQI